MTDNTISSFVYEAGAGRVSSILVYNVTEIRRSEKAVQLRCGESGRTYWVPLSFFEGSRGSVVLKPWAFQLLAEGGKLFVASEALDHIFGS